LVGERRISRVEIGRMRTVTLMVAMVLGRRVLVERREGE